MTYKLAPSDPAFSQESNQVIRLVDNAWIPFDPANTDYQEYLEWVAEGNTPDPAE